MTKPAQAPQQILQALRAPAVPVEARADHLIYAVGEMGLDLRPAVISLLQEADEGRRLKAKAEEDAAVPLSSETFLARTEHNGRVLAAVTNGASDLYLPCKPDEIKDLACGDSVLIDPRNARIVGRDGSLPRTGDVVSVEIVPADIPGQVVVRHHDQSVTARVAARLQGADKGLAPGTRVVYDAQRKIVTHVLEGRSDGKELLTPLEALSKVGRKDLGAPHPVLEEMLFRLKMWATCPDWMKALRARPRMSYLLTGPTGTGKTMHLKVLAAEIADLTERLTGQRVSRLVMCNASQFYSPWFGQTEENITRWFDALGRLGAACLRTRDGREFRVPLLVVMEEAESLLRTRGDFGGSSHLFDRPLALILQRLDALTDELNVPLLFCSTSNRPDLIDPAARRRLGVTQVTFGTLNAAQAASVLDKKIPTDMPVRLGGKAGDAAARPVVMNQVLAYLYGNDPEQGLAEVRLVNAERRTLCRRDVITPALLEQAVSTAIDDCLRQSADAGELLGVDGEAVIRALHAQFTGLAAALRPQNLREHCPEWFAGETIHVEEVRALVRRNRQPRSLSLR